MTNQQGISSCTHLGNNHLKFDMKSILAKEFRYLKVQLQLSMDVVSGQISFIVIRQKAQKVNRQPEASHNIDIYWKIR